MSHIYSLIDSFSLKELILVGSIFLLLITVFLLFVYTIYLRIYNNIKKKIIQKKQKGWENSILKYISGEPGTTSFDLDVKYKDFQIFGEFVENYLINLKGEDYEHIVQQLRDIGYGEMLIKALDKADKWGRGYAAHFLGLMEYKQAKPRLLELIHDKSPVVYINSFEALNRIVSEENLPRLIKLIVGNIHIGTTKIIEILLGYGTVINPILIEMLGAPDIDSFGKKLIVDILSFHRAIESSKAVLRLTKQTDNIELKIACIKAFGLLEDPENAPYLIESLNSENGVIRSESAKALGKIGAELAIPFLKAKLYSDKNYWVRLHSTLALKKMHEKGLFALNEVLMNTSDTQVNRIINYVIQEEDALI